MPKSIPSSGQIDQHLRKVAAAYNADHDLGPDAPVTWREIELMQAVAKLLQKVEKLEEKLDDLDSTVNGIYQHQERQVQSV
jgi:hypothetical protein